MSSSPRGAVLVVGSGPSDVQIADELNRAGRQVYLSIGSHQRVPRRYRGRDCVWWWSRMGVLEAPTETRPPGPPLGLAISGAHGPGYTIDFRDFAARGMVLLGRAQEARDGVMTFAQDLPERLAAGDAIYLKFLDSVDTFASRERLNVPADPHARVLMPLPPALTDPPSRLDLRAAGVGTVIWCTGYGPRFDWIHLPVLNEHGHPRHRHGVTEHPGLYFLGMSFLRHFIPRFSRELRSTRRGWRTILGWRQHSCHQMQSDRHG